MKCDLPLFRGVFIRAPAIERVGDAVEVLAEHNGRPVLAREGRGDASGDGDR